MVKLPGLSVVPSYSRNLVKNCIYEVQINLHTCPLCILTPNHKSNSEHGQLYGTSSQTIIAYNPCHKATTGGMAIDISCVFLLHFVSFSNPNIDQPEFVSTRLKGKYLSQPFLKNNCVVQSVPSQHETVLTKQQRCNKNIYHPQVIGLF